MKNMLGTIAVCGAMVFTGCESNAEKLAQNGDTVVIDFAGFLGTEQFQGGTAQNYPLTLGSGQFVPGFEEQLVGAKIGESRDVKITFPKDYVPNLAGKDVVFKVTVRDILKK
ncbi:MAG: FKBP-type peptidyl-prolyl cis-trans isomerase [Alphaproteobacteria bacterium]|nr:FKBP-type peptidyl-prolyl cis-trans isomerase [Alphaproteobacteria bacterium]